MDEHYGLALQLERAERLARQWMPGFRQAQPGQEPRPSWEHPHDLVKLLAERPGDFSEAGQKMAICIAWMHDLLEDGVKEDGTPVTVSDLGPDFDPRILDGVEQLTHPKGIDKLGYYRLLKDIDYLPRMVKCVDRICNLREGKLTFKPRRWERYVFETEQYILPLTEALRDETRDWLAQLLREAMI